LLGRPLGTECTPSALVELRSRRGAMAPDKAEVDEARRIAERERNKERLLRMFTGRPASA
jgi:hypothetical protein